MEIASNSMDSNKKERLKNTSNDIHLELFSHLWCCGPAQGGTPKHPLTDYCLNPTCQTPETDALFIPALFQFGHPCNFIFKKALFHIFICKLYQFIRKWKKPFPDHYYSLCYLAFSSLVSVQICFVLMAGNFFQAVFYML